MAATLLITGVTLFLVGSLGLIIRLRERGKAGITVCLPLASVVPARECWPDVRFFVLARLLGLALVAVGLGLAVARDPMLLEDPRRFWGVEKAPVIEGSKQVEVNRFVNASEAILTAIRHDTDKDLSGRIHGEPFAYDRVEVIEHVLSARQGSGFLPELEIRIFFPPEFSVDDIDERETVSVQPGDPVSPEVHISWRDEQNKLQTEIVRRGYRMELQLAPLDRHQLKGFLQLILPDATRSFLSGEFIAYTNHLRYEQGQVDLGYTHPDTLEYAARRFLQKQYPTGAIDRIEFADTVIKGSRTEGATRARIELDGGRVERREIGLQLAHGEWGVRRESVTREVVRRRGGDENGADADAGDDDGEGRERDSAGESGRLIEFAELAEYVGREVRTQRLDGKLQQGTVKKVDDDRVELETSLSGGTVRYHVKKDRLDRVRLDNGDTLIIESNRNDGDVAGEDDAGADDSDPAPREDEEEADHTDDRDRPDELARLEALEGQRIRITDTEGKSRTGDLTAVDGEEITLTVPMGSGTVDYYYELSEVDEFKAVEP